MPAAAHELQVEHDAPIRTWFRVGGSAKRLARPRDETQLRQCCELDPDLQILGSGANLLVDDAGVENLVVSLDAPAFKQVDIDPKSGSVRAGAGADLARLILDCQRAGLAGLENLGGVPATVGGALRMNAGGRYGEIAQYLRSIRATDRNGQMRTIERDDIDFAYRSSGLENLILCEAEFTLTHDDPPAIRERLLSIMRDKKHSQPMGENSAGCCYKNPTLESDIDAIGAAGDRVSAGLIIDRAGCKGLAVRGAEVSRRHANFVTTRKDARARDVIELMQQVKRRVRDRFAIELEPEVVIWGVGE